MGLPVMGKVIEISGFDDDQNDQTNHVEELSDFESEFYIDRRECSKVDLPPNIFLIGGRDLTKLDNELRLWTSARLGPYLGVTNKTISNWAKYLLKIYNTAAQQELINLPTEGKDINKYSVFAIKAMAVMQQHVSKKLPLRNEKGEVLIENGKVVKVRNENYRSVAHYTSAAVDWRISRKFSSGKGGAITPAIQGELIEDDPFDEMLENAESVTADSITALDEFENKFFSFCDDYGRRLSVKGTNRIIQGVQEGLQDGLQVLGEITEVGRQKEN